LNREPKFYNHPKNLKKPAHKRNKPWPTVDEFWASEEPVSFRLMASEQADHRKFKRWLLKHLREVEGTDYDYDRECLEKF